MKLYKYRSLDNMDYVFDILSNGLVYCSSYKDLNDPFEGQFRKLYSKSQFGTQQYGDIPGIKYCVDQHKQCSIDASRAKENNV